MLIHPWFVAAAWWQLYGFPWDPRLWIAFFVHDWGYWGKSNMDGVEGETHPELGARIMGALFGHEWFKFALYHSRFYAKQHGKPISRLCLADKLAIVLTPAWLYVPMARLTGEIAEYRQGQHGRTSARVTSKGWHHADEESDWGWYQRVRDYLRGYVAEHKDGRSDTWTL